MSMQRMVSFLLCLTAIQPVFAELAISEPYQPALEGESFQLKEASLPHEFTVSRRVDMAYKARMLSRFSPYVAAAAVVIYIVGAKAFIMAPPWSIVLLMGLAVDYLFETLVFSNRFTSRLAPFALLSMFMKQSKQLSNYAAQFGLIPDDEREQEPPGAAAG